MCVLNNLIVFFLCLWIKQGCIMALLWLCYGFAMGFIMALLWEGFCFSFLG
jgi:hypothetical protein